MIQSSTIHSIIVSGELYMCIATVIAIFGLYKMGFHKMVANFFTGKTDNNG
jgi:hypothetical protein